MASSYPSAFDFPLGKYRIHIVAGDLPASHGDVHMVAGKENTWLESLLQASSPRYVPISIMAMLDD